MNKPLYFLLNTEFHHLQNLKNLYFYLLYRNMNMAINMIY